MAQSVALSGVALWTTGGVGVGRGKDEIVDCSHYTTDIGGYYGGSATDPVFQELIVRWIQL